MIMQQSKIQEHLETFRRYFPKAKKCYVSQDFISYGYTEIRHAATDCTSANKLINQMNLPLVAIHSQNSKSFVVQSNETPDI